MPRPLADAVGLITDASSGIGRASAVACARSGSRLVRAARGEDGLRMAVEDCRGAGGDAIAVPTDVTDEEAVRRLAERAEQHFGRIDVWVNNAGVIAYGRFDELPAVEFRQVIETNLFGQVHGAPSHGGPCGLTTSRAASGLLSVHPRPRRWTSEASRI